MGGGGKGEGFITTQDLQFVSQVQQMIAANPLSIQGMDKLNFLVGRAYCSDQESDDMCEHRDGSELDDEVNFI